MRIDAHQHFWDLERFSYPWMPPAPSTLRQNYLPADLAPIFERNNFDGSIVVQATTSAEETSWLLELASQNDLILGVVGWVDLTDPRVGATLDKYQQHPKFRGVRHPVHDEPDLNWLVRDDVIAGLRELARRGLPYDLLLFPEHLPLVPRLAESVPDLLMVIDHIAKPKIARGQMEGWAQGMERAAEIPRVHAKLSGMITEADPTNWKAEDLAPFVRHVYGLFGPDRLMFGSDWPVCLLAGTWKEVLAAFTQSLGPIPQEDRSKLLGDTAEAVYLTSSR
jgi:L-fuconolactonase